MLNRLNELAAWQALCQESEAKKYFIGKGEHLVNTSHTVSDCGITLNYAMQFIAPEALNTLVTLANESLLQARRDDLFSGKKLNFSENRAVLHTALRAPYEKNLSMLGQSKANDIHASLKQMSAISKDIRTGKWLGVTGKPIKNIINIGIGGSDLAPRMSLEALKPLTDKMLNYFFISDADPSSFQDVCERINIEESLFIVVSKSFATRETLINAQKVIKLFEAGTNIEQHIIAVTMENNKAHFLGIKTILPLWDWVGGRFSLCSAVNLMLMIAIGEPAFKQMLEGAHEMDEHFQSARFKGNMPVLLALLGIFNINMRNINSHSVLVYNSRLKYFSDYLQQLEMESNGKSLNKWGEKIKYKASPIVWGGVGNRAQHAYYQLLVQGTQKVSLDFIFDASREAELVDAYGRNKINILSQGKSTNDWSHIEGKQPLNSISIDELTPYCLGSLVALYEHKVFVQGVIWQINSFDQFGVESAKQLSIL